MLLLYRLNLAWFLFLSFTPSLLFLLFFFFPFTLFPLLHPYVPCTPESFHPMSATRGSIDNRYMWLGLYFAFNLGLTLYNKAILLDFRYPWTLTAIHTLCGSIGCYILYFLGYFTPVKLKEQENMVMLMFSVLYTINIAISNVSL